MSDKPDATQIHLHRFAVPCAVHGRHVYFLAGLDHGVDDAAFYLLRTLRRNGHQPEYDHAELDVKTIEAHLFDSEGETDDIPF
jgi:hypothetical protein